MDDELLGGAQDVGEGTCYHLSGSKIERLFHEDQGPKAKESATP